MTEDGYTCSTAASILLHIASPGAGLHNMVSLLTCAAPGLGWPRELRTGGGRMDGLLTWQLGSLSEDSKKRVFKEAQVENHRAFYDLTSEFSKCYFLILKNQVTKSSPDSIGGKE